MTLVNSLRAILLAAKSRFQYRVDFFMTLISTLMFCVLYYMVWKAVYAVGTPAMEWKTLSTYVMVGQVVSFTRFSKAERGPIYMMASRIYSGDISLDLIRPIGFQMQRFLEAAGFLLVEIVWVILPSWFLCLFVFKISPPANTAALMGFLASILIAFLVAFSLNSILMMLNFYTINAQGMHKAKKALLEILAGTIIPFEFFPFWMKTICRYLPFQSMAYIPLSIYTGMISGFKILTSLGEQLLWAGFMFGLSRLIWLKASRKITIFGG